MDNSFDFNRLHEKYIRLERATDRPPIYLWHYTSANGLMGIVRNNPLDHGKLHFWFTRSDFLNDTSEGTHILDIFEKVLEKLFVNGKLDQPFYNLLQNTTISNSQYISYPTPSEEENCSSSMLDVADCDMYICSFSQKEDSLDMWRYYSKNNGGYGLKCAYFIFDKHKNYEHSEFKKDALFSMIESYKVIYDDTEKETILEEIILDTFSAYKNSKECQEDTFELTKQFISYILKIYQFQFKHKCYSSEQEYRFVFYQPRSKPQLLENNLYEIKYRQQNGEIVPYLDVEIDRNYAHLSEVLISPYVKNSGAVDATKDYLTICGFHNCDVRKSDLPVRE